MRVPLAALAALALLAAPAVPAGAVEPDRKGRSLLRSKLLWATVNICDTKGHPNGIGIRGSMPGSGFRDETMHMRFQVQYFKRSERRWHNIGADADSGFLEVGSAMRRRREAGSTFTIEPPSDGGSYVLRGAVTFEWRDEDGEVVRRTRRRTRSGHEEARGSDPAGYSAAECIVTSP